jgi:Ser/Thr protein kinase RdoA (MazF antagonist)
VLRVSLEDPNVGRLRFVDEAMEAARSATFDAPSSVPTISGYLLAELRGDRVARLLTWVEGVTADDAGRPATAARSIGRTAAEMLHVLEPLQPNYDRSFFLWDPGYSLRTIDDHRIHVLDEQQRSLIERVLSSLIPVPFDELPLQVIHSDLNAGNIVLSGDRVTGVIDFEDVAMTIRIGELSVACAYAMLVQDDPIAVAMDVIAGYRETARPHRCRHGRDRWLPGDRLGHRVRGNPSLCTDPLAHGGLGLRSSIPATGESAPTPHLSHHVGSTREDVGNGH